MGTKGIVASSAGLSILLQEGIGDTIRVSLTPAPGGDRSEEVRVAQQILQSLGIRSFTPQVTACPGCGRTTSTFFQEMAEQIQAYLREQMPTWKERYTGVEEMKLAVMGCVVNGPGESKHANIGISLPGTFEEPKAPVYVDGQPLRHPPRRQHRPRVHPDPRRIRRLPLRQIRIPRPRLEILNIKRIMSFRSGAAASEPASAAPQMRLPHPFAFFMGFPLRPGLEPQ